MKLQEYDQFVFDSDWTKDKPSAERLRIARYGLAAEVGSLAAALKKKVLHQSDAKWDTSNQQIIEELGDCLWYVTQLAIIGRGTGLASIVAADLSALPEEIGKNEEFKNALDQEGYTRFVAEAPALIGKQGDALLDDYQTLAILTARTQGRELLDVCITRLLLYATSVMSRQFPNTEYHLKSDILKYSDDRTLGMLLWHLSAVASIYRVDLSNIAIENRIKIKSITKGSEDCATELFDAKLKRHEQFPREFSVSYISTSEGRLQMFYRGRPLGDELDDNSRTDDGYRFHDVLHLANAAVLGWSPVLRSLMNLKRKSDPETDRAEDGARARIVEEAIVKAVHSEAIRVGELEGLTPEESRARLFSDGNQVSYDFLNLVMTFADGLEVEKCESWEWRKAIVSGHRLFKELQREKQGTVKVDLVNRSVSFSPLVFPDVRGPVIDTAIEVFEAPKFRFRSLKKADRINTEKSAILRILKLNNKPDRLSELVLTYGDDDMVCVKASGECQKAVWKHEIIGFRTQWTQMGRRWICVAMAIGAPI